MSRHRILGLALLVFGLAAFAHAGDKKKAPPAGGSGGTKGGSLADAMKAAAAEASGPWTGQVVLENGRYLLKRGPNDKTYVLDGAGKVEAWAGKQARVEGQLDARAGVVKVSAIGAPR